MLNRKFFIVHPARFRVGTRITPKVFAYSVYIIDEIKMIDGENYCYYHLHLNGIERAPVLCAPLWCIEEFYDPLPDQKRDCFYPEHGY